MRRWMIAAALAVLALPALAQDSAPGAEKPAKEATPIEDLDCALFFSYLLGSQEKEADSQQMMGLSVGVAYFVGRWENATGENIAEVMPKRYDELELNAFFQLGKPCGERLKTFGEKLQSASAGVAEVAKGN